MAGEVRILRAGDEARLFSFLEARLETSIFLLSNAERAGLVDRGEPFQGTYAAAFENGAVTAVVAHFWNGNVVVQGDEGLESAAHLATNTSGRSVRGLLGPLAFVRRARTALGLDEAPAALDSEDALFVLELERLRVPALLAEPSIAYRHPTEEDVTHAVAEWRVAYQVELLGAVRTPELEETTLRGMLQQRTLENCWVLTKRGAPVALTMVTASTRGIVQVGGVYTPPELRGKGYGRGVVAASLLAARERGMTRSTLFTAVDNQAAIRAYTALGYENRGDYGLVLLR